jgi:serine protease
VELLASTKNLEPRESGKRKDMVRFMVKGVMSKLAAIIIMVCFLAVGSSFAQTWVSPAQGSRLGALPTFSWTKVAGQDYSWVYIGSTSGGGDYYNTYVDNNTTSITVPGLPSDNSTVYVTILAYKAGYTSAQRSFKARNTGSYDGAVMTDPAANGTNIGSSGSCRFTWSNVGAASYYLCVGTTPGGQEIYGANTGTGTSVAVNGIPTDGTPVYTRVYSEFGSPISWFYSYSANNYNTAVPVMLTPTNHARLAKPATFTWQDIGADYYWLYLGSSAGGAQYYNVDQGTNLAATVPGLPSDNSTVYVRLWARFGTKWSYADYSYTANGTGTTDLAQMTTPAVNGSTLPSVTPTFTWSSVTGATSYWLCVGSTVNGSEFLGRDNGLATTYTMNAALPAATHIYVRVLTVCGYFYNTTSYDYYTP